MIGKRRVFLKRSKQTSLAAAAEISESEAVKETSLVLQLAKVAKGETNRQEMILISSVPVGDQISRIHGWPL
jgi:hypothetical protein